MMRGTDMSQLLMRKSHDVLPFEDASMVESTCVKYDCSLFAIGSHQKKRPDNLILGRVFDGHILDMFEVGVEQYRGMDQFKNAEHITKDLKPLLIFQGEPFDNSDKHQRLKNLMIGKFKHTIFDFSSKPVFFFRFLQNLGYGGDKYLRDAASDCVYVQRCE